MSLLGAIREMAQMVTDAIAAAWKVQVGICDDDYNLVAGTTEYLRARERRPNTSCQAAQYQEGKALVIENPGEHALCKGCAWEASCPDKAVLINPIHYRGCVVGCICLSALKSEERTPLLEDTASLLVFLERMAGLLTTSITEKTVQSKLEVALKELETTIDFASEGLLAVDCAGVIRQVNLPAATLLGLAKESLVGQDITSLFPAAGLDKVLKQGETIHEQEVTEHGKAGRGSFLMSVQPVVVDREVKGAIVSLRDMKQVKKLVYDFTSWHRSYSFQDIIGQSQGIREAKSKALQVAGSSSTVLLRGATGTGKELFARAIHTASPRSHGPFIAVNCAAIPDSLLESELFGYVDGAFTGAKRGGNPGKFELANKGTIFLDEVGELPLHLQAKLLRVLQEREVQRLGAKAPLSVDVRVIAATNRDLEQMVRDKSFREDLYYRLNVIPIWIPELKDRKEDILPLARFFLTKFSKLLTKEIHTFSPECQRLLLGYSWPGNVRELENVVEHAVNLATGREITPQDLPSSIINEQPARLTVPRNPAGLEEIRAISRSMEKDAIIEALRVYGMSERGKVLAAQALGMSRATLYRKIKKFGITGVALVRRASQP